MPDIADSHDLADICDGCREIFAECDCPDEATDHCPTCKNVWGYCECPED